MALLGAMMRRSGLVAAFLMFGFASFWLGRLEATERLCDPAYEDCRTPLINYIRNENVGIDVAFWFMQDARYKTEILNRWHGRRAGPHPRRSAREPDAIRATAT